MQFLRRHNLRQVWEKDSPASCRKLCRKAYVSTVSTWSPVVLFVRIMLERAEARDCRSRTAGRCEVAQSWPSVDLPDFSDLPELWNFFGTSWSSTVHFAWLRRSWQSWKLLEVNLRQHEVPEQHWQRELPVTAFFKGRSTDRSRLFADCYSRFFGTSMSNLCTSTSSLIYGRQSAFLSKKAGPGYVGLCRPL